MDRELESWFSGGGLADIGMMTAGLTPTFAVELDDAIAGVYRANLNDHCLTADVRNVELYGTPRFWFHVSPPCTNASVAKTNGGETELDVELARAIVRGIERRSPWFSLENVWGYRTFESFRLILEALSNNGYNLAYWHLNSANYGVPQTRKRLILCASRVKRVVQPHPTHTKTPDLFALPWVGWYGAIADLVPTLPDSQFAEWQIELLPKGWRDQKEPFMVDGLANNRGTSVTVVTGDRPSYTVKASAYKQASRAYIPSGRVVEITPECLARFQSVPGLYRLSGKASLDCKVLGNGFPCLLAQALVEAQKL